MIFLFFGCVFRCQNIGTVFSRRGENQCESIRVCLVEEVKSGKIENGGMMKKWKDRKKFYFSHFCLVNGKSELV